METRDIDTMEAGREMDAQIGHMMNESPRKEWWAQAGDGGIYCTFDTAGEAKQWDKDHRKRYPGSDYSTNGRIAQVDIWPDYSTDIGAAWAIVERMKPAHRFTFDTTDDWYQAGFVKRATTHEYVGDANTPALAICKAALKAMAVSHE